MLEDIDGLDVERGMSLFAGQRTLYMQALGYFVDLYGDGLAAVDKYIAGADGATREAAGREIHSMGGAAAALGAIELENAAHHIDTLIRGDRARPTAEEELRAELELLRDDLAALVGHLRQALGRRSAAGSACRDRRRPRSPRSSASRRRGGRSRSGTRACCARGRPCARCAAA